jgi:hypothetical protein
MHATLRAARAPFSLTFRLAILPAATAGEATGGFDAAREAAAGSERLVVARVAQASAS